MKCPYCDNPTPPNVFQCPSCGAPLPPTQQPPIPPQTHGKQPPTPPLYVQLPFPQQPAHASGIKKSVTIAVLLNCLIIGLGQIYLGQVGKGLLLLFLTIMIAIMTAGLGCVVMWIIAIIDAYNIGKKLQAGRVVEAWEWF